MIVRFITILVYNNNCHFDDAESLVSRRRFAIKDKQRIIKNEYSKLKIVL